MTNGGNMSVPPIQWWYSASSTSTYGGSIYMQKNKKSVDV
jgi:hypothetical protein